MFAKSTFLLLLATFSTPLFAVDGATLINQATVQAAGGFPYVISQPGSYKLSGNLLAGNTTAIKIIAISVSLDLNGFSISCSQCFNVAGISSTAADTSVANGSITGFPGNGPNQTTGGIYFGASPARADHVTVYSCREGIIAAGSVQVSFSSFFNNADTGVSGTSVTVTNSQMTGNGLYGVAGFSVTLTGSTLDNNGLAAGGTGGGMLAQTGTITGNMFLNNLGFGINSLSGLVIAATNAFYGNSLGMGGVFSAGNNICKATPSGLC